MRTARRAFSAGVRGLTSGPLRKRANQLTGLAGLQGRAGACGAVISADGAEPGGVAGSWSAGRGEFAGFTGQGGRGVVFAAGVAGRDWGCGDCGRGESAAGVWASSPCAEKSRRAAPRMMRRESQRRGAAGVVLP